MIADKIIHVVMVILITALVTYITCSTIDRKRAVDLKHGQYVVDARTGRVSFEWFDFSGKEDSND